MNHDGVTDLDDAVILHNALVAATGKGLDFSLLNHANVPEPASSALLFIAALGIGSFRRSRKRPRTSMKNFACLLPVSKINRSERGEWARVAS